MTRILTLLFLAITVSTHAQEWNHTSGRVTTGQIDLKDANGTVRNLPSNTGTINSTSVSTVPLVIAAGGSYDFGYGIKLTNGDYYMRENNLDAYVRMSTADFEANFIATEHLLEPINTYQTNSTSNSCSVNGSFNDPNIPAVSQDGATCSASVSVSGQTQNHCNPPSNGGDRCYCSASSNYLSCHGSTSTYSGYRAGGSISGSGASISLSVPVLGGSLSCTGTGLRQRGTNTTSATNPLYQSFSNGFTITSSGSAWSKTATTSDGVLRGFGYVRVDCSGGSPAITQSAYVWVRPDGSTANNYSSFPTGNIYWSQDEQVYVGWGGVGSGIYVLDNSGVGVQIGENVAAAPAALLSGINGL